MKKLLSIVEFAGRVGVDPVTVRRWHKRGTLIPVEVDPVKGRLYDSSQIEEGQKVLSANLETQARGGVKKYLPGKIYGRDVRARVGLSRETLHEYIKSGVVRPRRVTGNRYVFTEADVETIRARYLANCAALGKEPGYVAG